LNDIDDSTDKLVECNDGLLERVAALLDSWEKEMKAEGQSDIINSDAPQ